MEDAEAIVASSSSPRPATPISEAKPQAKSKSKKTKADLEAELADVKAELAQLRADVALFNQDKLTLRDKETKLDNERQELKWKMDLLEWGYEQQEAVLHEAAARNIKLAHAVLEQRYVLEQRIAERLAEISDSSGDSAS